MGWDRPFRTSLDRRWTMTFCFGRRCEFDKVGLFSSAFMVPIASALLVVIRIGSGNEVCHLERRLHFCYPCRRCEFKKPYSARSAFSVPCLVLQCCFMSNAMLLVVSWWGIDRVPWLRFGVSNDVEA